MTVNQGVFEFNLPMTYFPKMKNVVKKDEGVDQPEIEFNFEAEVTGQQNFDKVCHPKNFEAQENSLNDFTIKKVKADFSDIKKDIVIMYNTTSPDNSRYLYQKNEKMYPGKIAVMAQFLPSFSTKTVTSDKITFTTDPFDLQDDDQDDEIQNKMAFIFVVDRSGSMSGMRIALVVEALQLFMQCLPNGCTFKIISYGTSFDSRQHKMTPYNE